MKIKYLSVPAALFAAWRAYIIVAYTQDGTGFLPRGSMMGWFYTLPLLAVCAWLYFSAWKKAPGAGVSGKGAMLQGSALQRATLLAAAGLAISAALALRVTFRGSLFFVAATAVAAVCLLLLVPAAAGRRTARPEADGYLALVLVFWGVVALLCMFLSNNTITSIPENTLSLLSTAALLATLFFCGQASSGDGDGRQLSANRVRLGADWYRGRAAGAPAAGDGLCRPLCHKEHAHRLCRVLYAARHLGKPLCRRKEGRRVHHRIRRGGGVDQRAVQAATPDWRWSR